MLWTDPSVPAFFRSLLDAAPALRIFMAVTCLLGTGCDVVMLESPFEDADIYSAPEFVGVWKHSRAYKGQTWTVRATPNSRQDHYIIVWRESQENRQFRARLARFQGRTFLEIHSTQGTDDDVPAMLPVHVVYRINIKKDRLGVEMFRGGSGNLKNGGPDIETEFAAYKVAVPALYRAYGTYYPYKSEVLCCVLTGRRTELRSFLTQWGNSGDMFNTGDEFVRNEGE